MTPPERIIHSLPNGLRIVAQRSDSPVAYIGIVAGSGSRDDGRHPGIAHFVEHTIFKGTPSRSSWHVSNRMESVGGELNAYTTKEEVMIYTNAPSGHEERALQLIADLVMNASFPEREIELERDVITEEIHSYHDNPSDAVYDEFDELIYAGTPLAHNILGSPESVNAISGEDARRFLTDRFTPPNMVTYCVSPMAPARAIRLVEKHFGNMVGAPAERTPLGEEEAARFVETRERGNHQANSITGRRIFGRRDPRRHAMFLLNNLLGGPAMNSRLNQKLRERHGLVYTVDSTLALYSDTGALQIYFGSEKEKIAKCCRLIDRELAELADHRLSPRSFVQARNQYCGQLLVSGDHRESCAMALAKSMLYYGEVHDIHYTAERIRAVTAEELRQAAELLACSPLSRLTLI